MLAACALSAAPESVLVRMTQSKYVSILPEPVVGECSLAADASGRVRWRVLSPFESLTICNERGVFAFEKTSDGWRRLDTPFAEAVRRTAREIGRLAIGESSEDYNVRRDGDTATLTPKSAGVRKFIKKIVVVYSGRFPKSLEFFETNGDKTVLSISEIRENPKEIEAAFDEKNFDKPEF